MGMRWGKDTTTRLESNPCRDRGLMVAKIRLRCRLHVPRPALRLDSRKDRQLYEKY